MYQLKVSLQFQDETFNIFHFCSKRLSNQTIPLKSASSHFPTTLPLLSLHFLFILFKFTRRLFSQFSFHVSTLYSYLPSLVIKPQVQTHTHAHEPRHARKHASTTPSSKIDFLPLFNYSPFIIFAISVHFFLVQRTTITTDPIKFSQERIFITSRFYILYTFGWNLLLELNSRNF